MGIKAILTEVDYITALQELSALIDLDPALNTPEGERLGALGTLVQAYEAKHDPKLLVALADAAKGAADRAGSAIDDAMAVIAESNGWIASLESAALTSRSALGHIFQKGQ